MLLVCLGLGLVGRAGRPVAADPSAVVLELMAEGNIPGLSAAVTVGGELVWTDGLGSTYPESGEQRYLATADTAFTFASVSKTITGVAVLMLRERGLLDVEADVNTILPYQVARRGITTAQLMSKCSRFLSGFLASLKGAAIPLRLPSKPQSSGCCQRTRPPSPTTITSPSRRTSSTWMATP